MYVGRSASAIPPRPVLRVGSGLILRDCPNCWKNSTAPVGEFCHLAACWTCLAVGT